MKPHTSGERIMFEYPKFEGINGVYLLCEIINYV